jgi:hypothetical protein
MAKIAKSPLVKFLQESLKMARRRDVVNCRVGDDGVTVDYLLGIYHAQNGECFWSGETMTMERGLNEENAVTWSLCTIDRINNNIGYVRGNLRMACDGVNRMRSNMSDAKFASLCKKIGMRG